MSEINTHIKITAPKYPLCGPEKIIIENQRCGYCKGIGYFIDDTKTIEPVRKACPLCKGRGKLNAEVVINWKPST